MKIDHVIDYISLTANHFTTYQQPDNIRHLVDQNRDLMANIAETAGNSIARQARDDARRHMLPGGVDLKV